MRVSRTVLRETDGESPSVYSPVSVPIVKQRQDRRQRILGEQLLAAEHDDQKPDRISE